MGRFGKSDPYPLFFFFEKESEETLTAKGCKHLSLDKFTPVQFLPVMHGFGGGK
jgi:hypothetical protein